MPSLDDMKRMADKKAEPLLATLKADPKNAALLNKTGLTYKAGHTVQEAIVYFRMSLDIDPKNVAVRDDMASCMYYNGDVDGALDSAEQVAHLRSQGTPERCSTSESSSVARQENDVKARSSRGKHCSSSIPTSRRRKRLKA